MFWWFIVPLVALAALISAGVLIDLKAKKEDRPLGGNESGAKRICCKSVFSQDHGTTQQ